MYYMSDVGVNRGMNYAATDIGLWLEWRDIGGVLDVVVVGCIMNRIGISLTPKLTRSSSDTPHGIHYHYFYLIGLER